MLCERLCVPMVAVAFFGFAGVACAAEDDDGAIKYRQSVMKSVGGHAGAAYQIVKNGNSNKAHLQAHARALSDLMGMIPGAFNRKTSGGKTRAKDSIWNDAAGFESAARDAEAAAEAFDAAARTGDQAQIDQKLDALMDSCKGCHDDYREKKQ